MSNVNLMFPPFVPRAVKHKKRDVTSRGTAFNPDKFIRIYTAVICQLNEIAVLYLDNTLYARNLVIVTFLLFFLFSHLRFVDR